MINLFRLNSGEDGIVAKRFENTEAYYRYLDRRLFMNIEKQSVFCPGCGTFEVNPKDFPELKYCPRCGNTNPMWAWNGATKVSKEVPILINASVKNSTEMVIMLSTIAAKRGIKIVWYVKDENGDPKMLYV